MREPYRTDNLSVFAKSANRAELNMRAYILLWIIDLKSFLIQRFWILSSKEKEIGRIANFEQSFKLKNNMIALVRISHHRQ